MTLHAHLPSKIYIVFLKKQRKIQSVLDNHSSMTTRQYTQVKGTNFPML